MDVPRVFISSTCYDLNEVRRQLEKFIEEELGYEPIMSDTISFKVEKRRSAIDACLKLIPQCHFFVLVIGDRYGQKIDREDKSITNKEYEVAAKNGLLIYPFVKKNVWDSLQIYNQNIDKSLKFPFVDNVKLFEFINEVQTASKDNFIWKFEDSNEIIAALRMQFAYLFNDLLNNEIKLHTEERHFEGRTRCLVALRLGWVLRNILLFMPLGDYAQKRVNDSLEYLNEILRGYRLFDPKGSEELVEFIELKKEILKNGSFFRDLKTEAYLKDTLLKLQLSQNNLEQNLRLRLSGACKYYFLLGHTLAQMTLYTTHMQGNYEMDEFKTESDMLKVIQDQIETCLKNLSLSKEIESRISRLADSLAPSSTYDEYFPEAQAIVIQIGIYLGI